MTIISSIRKLYENHKVLVQWCLVFVVFYSAVRVGIKFDEIHHNRGSDNAGDYLAGVAQMNYQLTTGELTLIELLNPGYIQAPLPLILSQPLFLIENRTIDTFRRINLFYLALLVAMTFALARKLFNSLIAGYLAAIVTVTSPSIFPAAWFFNNYLLTALMLEASFFCLISSDFFIRKKWVILAGLAVCGALLAHRGSPLLILLPPLLIYSAVAWRKVNPRVAAEGLLIVLIVGLLPTAPYLLDYYSSHMAPALMDQPPLEQAKGIAETLLSLEESKGALTGEISVGTGAKADYLYYFRTFHRFQFLKIISPLLIPAYLLLFWHGRRKPVYWVLLLTPLLPLFWFGFFGSKFNFYVYPLVPFFAVILSGAVAKAPYKKIRWGLAGTVALLSVAFGWFLPDIVCDMNQNNTGKPPMLSTMTNVFAMTRYPFLPGLNRVCDELKTELEEVEKGQAAVLVVSAKEDGSYLPNSPGFARDLTTCIMLLRSDIPVAQVNFGYPTNDDAMAEIWFYYKDNENFNAAKRWGNLQRNSEPGIVVAEYPKQMPVGYDRLARPKGNIVPLDNTYRNRNVFLVGYRPDSESSPPSL